MWLIQSMIQGHRRKPSESKGQHAYYYVKMVSKMSPDIDVTSPPSSHCCPQACSPDNGIWPLFSAQCIICFMTNSITLKGILRDHGAIENHKKEVFLCVRPSIFYCFPRGGSMANVIFSGCWRSKHSENYWTEDLLFIFSGDLLGVLSCWPLPFPGLS